jgi:hypothetical protein
MGAACSADPTIDFQYHVHTAIGRLWYCAALLTIELSSTKLALFIVQLKTKSKWFDLTMALNILLLSTPGPYL